MQTKGCLQLCCIWFDIWSLSQICTLENSPFPQVIKPLGDSIEYKVVVLPNQLQVVLMSDPTTEKVNKIQ
jgi:hypothetical protein